MKLNQFKKVFLIILALVGFSGQKLYSAYRLLVRPRGRTELIITLSDDKKFVGEVRFDYDVKGTVKIIRVAKEFRGKGIGGQLFEFTRDFMALLGSKKISWYASPLGSDAPAGGFTAEQEAAIVKRLMSFYRWHGGKISSFGGGFTKMYYMSRNGVFIESPLKEYFLKAIRRSRGFEVAVKSEVV